MKTDQYYASAAFNLAAMAAAGHGCEKSIVNALKWLSVALSMCPNSDTFKCSMEKLKNGATAQEVAAAELLATDWIKNRDEEISGLTKDSPWLKVGL